MAVKQTAGRDALGVFPRNSQSSMTMSCSVRYGVERTGYPCGTARW